MHDNSCKEDTFDNGSMVEDRNDTKCVCDHIFWSVFHALYRR